MGSWCIVHKPPWGTNAWFHHIFQSKNIPKTMSSIACWDFSVHFYLKQFLIVLWSSWYLSCTSWYSEPGFCQVRRTYGSVFTNFASKVMSGYVNHGTIWQYRNATNQVVNYFFLSGKLVIKHTSGDCPAIWIWIFWQWFDLNYAVLVVSGVILCSSHPIPLDFYVVLVRSVAGDVKQESLDSRWTLRFL